MSLCQKHVHVPPIVLDVAEGTGCLFGGTCFNNTCCCTPEYEGEICQTEVDACDPNPCLNGGLCRDELMGFTCFCAEGQ